MPRMLKVPSVMAPTPPSTLYVPNGAKSFASNMLYVFNMEIVPGDSLVTVSVIDPESDDPGDCVFGSFAFHSEGLTRSLAKNGAFHVPPGSPSSPSSLTW